MRSAQSIALELCRFLEAERLDYALLGDVIAQQVPNPRQIEVVVPEGCIAQWPAQLQKFCTQSQLQLVCCERPELHCWRALLSWTDREGHPAFVVVVARSALVRGGRTLLSTADLLRERRLELGPLGRKPGYFLVSSAVEFVHSLVRYVCTSDLRQDHERHLSASWHREPAQARAQAERSFGAQCAAMLERAVQAGEWDVVRQSLSQLRDAWCSLHPLRVQDALLELALRSEKWLRPSGMLVACLGPDGSGKSTTIDRLCTHPPAPFTAVTPMDLRPRVLRPVPSDPNAEPRSQRPWGRIGTIAKLLMFAADYWLGFWSRVRPRMARSELVISNRYYDDVLVDPSRYRMARPRIFARALLPWIPRPDLWLVFDAPSEVLSTRQHTLSAAEVRRQRGEYRRLLRERENVVLLDARQSPDQVLAQAERAIVTHLALRTASRFNLPQQQPQNPLSARVLLFFCRRHVPLISRLIRVIFNSDISCRLPFDLHMPHPYGIVIHAQAVIGRRVTVMQQVAIGDKDHTESVAPVIGDDVYIGAGARILGDVRIGDRVTIGANAVVTCDIPAGVTVVGANRIVNAPGMADEPHAEAHDVTSVTPFPIGAQRGG